MDNTDYIRIALVDMGFVFDSEYKNYKKYIPRENDKNGFYISMNPNAFIREGSTLRKSESSRSMTKELIENGKRILENSTIIPEWNGILISKTAGESTDAHFFLSQIGVPCIKYSDDGLMQNKFGKFYILPLIDRIELYKNAK